MPEQRLEIPPQALSALATLRAAVQNSVPPGTEFGIGAKQSAGEFLGELALIVYVPEKLPENALRPEQMIPPTITEQGVEFLTDVVQSTRTPIALLNDTKVALQLSGGIDIGFFDPAKGAVVHGTAGCVVQRRSDGGRQLLTAAHVAPIGTVMSQPAPGASQSAPVGTIVNADTSPTLDCSVIELNGLRSTLAEIVEIGSNRGAADFALFASATKRGRTTGLTAGLVVAVMPDANRIVLATFPFGGLYCHQGDSGSVVLDGNGEVIGLLVEEGDLQTDAGGNPVSSVGLAVPIRAVLDALQIEIAVSPPIITSIDPNAAGGLLASGGVTQIDGAGFDAASQVMFGGVPAVTVIPASPLRLLVTPPTQFAPGAVTDVIVTNAIGEQSLPSVIAQFTF
ncbi:hypothetical protein [Microbacterium deminutum]|uniref:IPT/TIG domain-containing protein n=1 Tax=Microbacterium deminutum TaxID=344164 RepID=A0ABN2RJG3_9MICO